MEYVLKTHNVSKMYGNQVAVKEVNLNIKKGEIYGFLGQNGAGKTTTLRMITGLIRPSSGNITLFGEDLERNKRVIFERIGSTIEFPGFYQNLTVYQNLNLHLLLMGMDRDEALILDTLNTVGIARAKSRKVKELSLGMKQRLGIARAIIHGPELLILDEPLNGLDPIGIKEIRELLLDLSRSKGLTILMSTHILSEVEQIATTIGIINNGLLVEEINIKEMQRQSQHYVELKVDDEKKACRVIEEVLSYTKFKVIQQGVIRLYEGIDNTSAIIRILNTEGVNIMSIKVKEDTIEDYFLRVTGGSIDG